MMERFAPGLGVTRSEDFRLLTGGGHYLDDRNVPGQAHAVMVRSPHAHARIRAIHAEDARATPGVLAVLTGDDYRDDGLGALPCLDSCRRRDGSAMVAPPHPALPRVRVLFVGEAVAMVIADSAAVARDAAERVVVDYQPLAAVAGIARATAGDAPVGWPDFPANECFHAVVGDGVAVDRAFANAAHKVEQTLVNHRVLANSMETRGYLGHYDAASARFTLYGGVHGPHALRAQLARHIFQAPEHRFRIVTGDVGGSFGMRGAMYPELVLVLWASKRLGRPVKWVAARSEAMVSDDHGRDMVSRAALALDGQGRFLALRVELTADMGAYLGVKGPRSALNTLSLLSGVYRFPAARVSATGIFTNTNATSPYRGAGGPEAVYILERLIDKAARDLGLDRVALRRTNLIAADAMPYDTGLGLSYDCGGFERTMDRALALAGVAEQGDRRAAAARRGHIYGIGVANAIEQTARPGMEGAEISLQADGGATVRAGTASQGQGHETIYKQLVCGSLGLDPDRIRVLDGDSDGTTAGGGTFNSRSAVCGGTAVRLALDKVIETGKAIAADLLETAAADMEFADGRFKVAGTDRTVTLQEVVEAGSGLAESATFTTTAPTFPSGTHICEVEIDPETGSVEIVRYTTVDDVGTVINPLLLDGQIHGGVVQGIGQALLEAVVFDPHSGQNLTGSLMDYAMPRADNLCAIRTGSSPVPTATNPLGAKGAGEAGTVGALPAVMCAVADALAELGGADMDMPATPERIWRAMKGRP